MKVLHFLVSEKYNYIHIYRKYLEWFIIKCSQWVMSGRWGLWQGGERISFSPLYVIIFSPKSIFISTFGGKNRILPLRKEGRELFSYPMGEQTQSFHFWSETMARLPGYAKKRNVGFSRFQNLFSRWFIAWYFLCSLCTASISANQSCYPRQAGENLSPRAQLVLPDKLGEKKSFGCLGPYGWFNLFQ